MDRVTGFVSEARLRAIKIYCEGVKADFPEAATWMDNVIHLTVLPKEIEADRPRKS